LLRSKASAQQFRHEKVTKKAADMREWADHVTKLQQWALVGDDLIDCGAPAATHAREP